MLFFPCHARLVFSTLMVFAAKICINHKADCCILPGSLETHLSCIGGPAARTAPYKSTRGGQETMNVHPSLPMSQVM